MPSNIKSDNQYFGKYFEIAVTAKINGDNEFPNPKNYEELCGYNFSQKEILYLNDEAKKIADYIGSNHYASRIGNHTLTELGDIILDNKIKIELKRVSCGSGTYHNTSIYYLTKFGFDFKKYMEQFQLYKAIENNFPSVKISYTNNSPVTQNDSSFIRHSNEEKYKEIEKIDFKMRKQFVLDLAEYFKKYPEKAQEFYKDMIYKVKTSQNKNNQKIVDRFIIFNYNNDSIDEINLDDFKKCQSEKIEANDFSLRIGKIRFVFGWQNGNGLNNPTIRVFLS